jgi:hypothetical protein
MPPIKAAANTAATMMRIRAKRLTAREASGGFWKRKGGVA